MKKLNWHDTKNCMIVDVISYIILTHNSVSLDTLIPLLSTQEMTEFPTLTKDITTSLIMPYTCTYYFFVCEAFLRQTVCVCMYVHIWFAFNNISSQKQIIWNFYTRSLAHWYNSPKVYMSLHKCCMLSRETGNYNFMIFGL
jgi:hypothetical protein